jgi:hypothetical protein
MSASNTMLSVFSTAWRPPLDVLALLILGLGVSVETSSGWTTVQQAGCYLAFSPSPQPSWYVLLSVLGWRGLPAGWEPISPWISSSQDPKLLLLDFPVIKSQTSPPQLPVSPLGTHEKRGYAWQLRQNSFFNIMLLKVSQSRIVQSVRILFSVHSSVVATVNSESFIFYLLTHT